MIEVFDNKNDKESRCNGDVIANSRSMFNVEEMKQNENKGKENRKKTDICARQVYGTTG